MVQKVLLSIPIRFNPKLSSIKEKKNLEKFTMDALLLILLAYEMRIGKERPSKREASLKVSQG